MATTQSLGGDSSAPRDATEYLRQSDESELNDVYKNARCPEISELEGRYLGTVLGGRVFPLTLKEGVGLLNGDWMPWAGKKIHPIDEEESRGCNWYEIGPFERNGFEFVGRLRPSTYGPGRAYVLDYDLPDNPDVVQGVRDELKQVDDELYLGRTYMRFRGEHRFLFYFALEPER
ncbi:MAG: hypothetical protein ACLFMT_01775 [Halobacteriales archaeon]